MAGRSPLTLTRRTLLAALSGAVGMAAPGARARGSAPTKQGWSLALRETYVAGTPYYEARRVVGGLRPGDALVLRREPDNAYDDLAIEVFTAAGPKLGYVPRADNEPFARLMDAGKAVTAEVTDVNPEGYGDVRMRLTLHAA